MHKLVGYLKLLVRLNIARTIYLNLRVFKFRLALKLPIYVFGPLKTPRLNGRIIINGPVKRGMIQFGALDENIIHTFEPIRLYLSGSIVFNGPCKFSRAVQLLVLDGAILEFGRNCWVGSFSKIVAFRRIEIQDDFLSSWECQIFDTDFHFIRNIPDSTINDNTSPVLIGKQVWLGSRVSVLKGVSLPDRCVVATGSVCNKNYQGLGTGVVIGGVPAKLLKENVEYVKDKFLERDLLRRFREEPDRT